MVPSALASCIQILNIPRLHDTLHILKERRDRQVWVDEETCWWPSGIRTWIAGDFVHSSTTAPKILTFVSLVQFFAILYFLFFCSQDYFVATQPHVQSTWMSELSSPHRGGRVIKTIRTSLDFFVLKRVTPTKTTNRLNMWHKIQKVLKHGCRKSSKWDWT